MVNLRRRRNLQALIVSTCSGWPVAMGPVRNGTACAVWDNSWGCPGKATPAPPACSSRSRTVQSIGSYPKNSLVSGNILGSLLWPPGGVRTEPNLPKEMVQCDCQPFTGSPKLRRHVLLITDRLYTLQQRNNKPVQSIKQ